MNSQIIKDQIISTHPLISVIVPVYNVGNYLNRCIESILNQNYKELELILIDDGSTDNSVEICKQYVELDQRVKLFQQNNQGSSIARNTGLLNTTGEYISFVDSDDWILPEMLESMIEYAINNDLAVVECESIKSTDSNIDKIISEKLFEFKTETNEEALARIIENQKFAVWRRIYSKKIIGNLKFIPYKLHQDVFFTIDILKKIKHQGYIKTPFYCYNVENISIIRSPYSQKKLDAIDATFYVLNETKDFNNNIKINAKKHVIQQLMYHYHELYSHDNLDPHYKVRILIKNEISKALSLQSWSTYGLLIKYLPFKVYRVFLRINEFRISSQIYLIKLLR
ncbi:Undecaprenyl-phosphate 4-deoxy-4-formamido-L-arabinose transferase [Arenibacter antarcticus]|uniref:Glycosyltransferase n=1 Tax=Arenibacter antarcticus TaxID=2040469 RepID=A0ABW5VKR7_9FLAO|nr:glycosyltransferase [Arenibacter sp. H213]MCM4167340.1 hypothetical protein [Arenibacter sp. H213]